MITDRAKKYISSGLAGLMIYASSGCQTFQGIGNEIKSFASNKEFDPLHEVTRYNEHKNAEPPKEIKPGVDYSIYQYRFPTDSKIINNRSYPKSESSVQLIPEESIAVTPLKRYNLPQINASFIDVDGTDDGNGELVVTYPSRIPPSDLINSIQPYLPGVEIKEVPGLNRIKFHSKKEAFGNNFDKLAGLLDDYDIPPQPVRVRVKIAKFFYDNTYDKAIDALKLIKEGMSVFSLNLPSSSDISKPLTTGITINPFYNTDRTGDFTITGGRELPHFTFEGAIKFLDSYGRTELVFDTDLLGLSGIPMTFKNTNSIPVPESVVTPTTVIETQKYREAGPDIGATAWVNESGFTTLELKELFGELTGFLGTLQKPTFSDTNLSTKVTLRNGLTYLVATSLDAKSSGVYRGLPGVSKIPIAKEIFSSRSLENKTAQFLFFAEVYPVGRDSLIGIQHPEEVKFTPQINTDSSKNGKSQKNKKSNGKNLESYTVQTGIQ